MLLSLLILYCAGDSLACWGGGAEDDDEPPKMNPNSMLNPHNKKHWGGWDPPPGAQQAWSHWLMKYYINNADKGSYKDSYGKPYGHDIHDWPSTWKGLGNPLEGAAPPPWAYVPKNLGKPIYCLDPALYGDCQESHTRYGYNPYTDQCVYFTYSGCGGNRNNFLTQLNCEKACVHPPVSGCSPESGIPIDNFVPS